MNEIYVENQPIFTKVLNVINNKSKFHQAYILVNEDKKKLDEYAFLLSSVLICPEKYKKECTKCNICHRIRNNVFGELKVIKPSNNTIKKEEIISLRNEFQTSSIEGNTTSLYIRKILENTDVKVTQIAQGVPIGTDMEYLDSLTLEMALANRNEIS